MPSSFELMMAGGARASWEYEAGAGEGWGGVRRKNSFCLMPERGESERESAQRRCLSRPESGRNKIDSKKVTEASGATQSEAQEDTVAGWGWDGYFVLDTRRFVVDHRRRCRHHQ